MRWIHTHSRIRRALLVITGLILTTPAISAGVVVHDQVQYREAVKDAQPGDAIVLANGEWRDFEILFTGKGTETKPITLTAEDKGKVFITGQSNLRLAGEYLVVSGLVFRDGHTPTSEVISFRQNSQNLANHSRVTEVVIDRFNNPERTETDYWVLLYGRNNRFDHNHLVGKSNNGVTMAVRLNTSESQQNHHRIDHNFFGPRPVLGSNGGETLRIGTSHYSLTDSFTTVENNWFEHCDGEVEIISSKSGGNVFRGNVFFESRGTLTLRHGNGNRVENNLFFGNGVDHTGGIRVINKRQVVRNNYLQGLRGYRFGSALTVMNGVPDSPINRYHQVEDSIIENNSVIDSHHIHLAAGSDEERSAVPLSTTFAKNLVYNEDGRDVFSVFDDISGITFADNVINQVKDPLISEGFVNTKVELVKGENGLLYPASEALQSAGISKDFKVLKRETTGAPWYPKPAYQTPFDSGATRSIEPGDSLEEAAASAQDGDILELAPGRYLAEKLIVLDRTLTVRSADRSRESTIIEFERNALFEITQGGALKLEGVTIAGNSAPDVAGNSVIRTSRYSMLGNYRLEISNSRFIDLDVNHSFNVLTVSKGTFADHIRISDSEFTNISGAVLELGKESDDLGLYNAEYVSIRNSTFSDIGKVLAVLYRGGTDESTFGPHFLLADSKLINVGNNKRNKSGGSLSLHGAQVTDIHGTEFADSAGVRVWQTVGEPITRITGNRFLATPAPVVENGPSLVENNVIESALAAGNEPAPAAEPGSRPRLLLSQGDLQLIRSAQSTPALFEESLRRAKQRVGRYLVDLPDIPVPLDPGGGYTHEQHKRNQATIYEAGALYLLTGEAAYADLVRRMLIEYAKLYPTLGEHPAKKNQSAGRLFWQNLNESVWLLHAIQGYDAIYESLDASQRREIEQGLFEPLASFLSVESPGTFNRIHNHGTWAVAAVGMTGYVLDREDMVEQALYGLERDGEAGFMKQLDELFSPDGYYTEGPYYQRYAIMPFVLFAEAIQRNDPEREIFEYRDGVLLKAVYALAHLSYDGSFFPVNDAMKGKGLDSGEFVYVMPIAYARTGDPSLVSVAANNNRVMLNGDGFQLAAAMEAGDSEPFAYRSMQFSDGPRGQRGALSILRDGSGPGHQALVLEATAQGLSHGHFDRLSWMYYDNGQEIVSDYGFARFVNVESKHGGRYLPENESWAKQTVAHNTLVVDQASQFDGDWKQSELVDTRSLVFESGDGTQIAAARMDGAYEGVGFSRAMLMLDSVNFQHPVILDVLRAEGGKPHRYDLPLYYQGHVTNVSHPVASGKTLSALGEENGYQHLWRRAEADVGSGGPFQLTFLNDARFYTYSAAAGVPMQVLFTQLGANDPEFNLRTEQGILLRVDDAESHTFAALLEPHGEYNRSLEYTTESESMVEGIEHFGDERLDGVRITTRDGGETLVAISWDPDEDKHHTLSIDGRDISWTGFYRVIEN